MKEKLFSRLAYASVLFVAIVAVAIPEPAHAIQFKGDYGTATASAGAATLSKTSGTITSESLTTAAGATYTLTLTNTRIAATSLILASVDAGSSTGSPVITSITPGSGSATIKVQNIHASAAFNAAIKIRFVVATK